MGKKTNQQVQSSSPWEPQQPFLQDLFGQAQQNYQSGGPDYFSGNTYVPFSSQTEQAFGMMENAAQNPSATETAVGGQLAGTLQGDFLNANPYLDATFDRAAQGVTEQFQDTVLPGINATFGMGGRTGSALHGETLSDAAGELSNSLGNLSTDIYGGNYQAERGRQLQAAGMAGIPGALEDRRIDMLSGVGGAIENQGRDIIADQKNRFDFYQNRPEQNLGTLAQLIGGNYGGESSGYTKQSPWQTAGNILGGLVPFI